METSFSVILRDITIILAATALIAMSLFGVLVAWQLYRLGREMHAEVQPILESVQGTSETLRGTAEFVGQRVTGRVSSLVGLYYAFRGTLQLLREFLQGLRREAPIERLPLPPTTVAHLSAALGSEAGSGTASGTGSESPAAPTQPTGAGGRGP